MKKQFKYGIDKLSVGIIQDMIRGDVKGVLCEKSKQAIIKSKKAVDEIVKNDKTVYGINTGFGPLCTTKISDEQTKKLQYNILTSHSVGVGNPIPPEIARIMMILKVHALAQGYSGISLQTLERILLFIEEDIIPLVPSQGSVGASGDLAPLAHLFLPLIGLGKVYYKNELHETSEVLTKKELKPIELCAKEGLALINGTQFIAAFAVKVVQKFLNALNSADIIGAMSLEAMLGSVRPFEEILHTIRPYKGSKTVASRLRNLLAGSEMVQSHAHCNRVQDPYSLRCMPQVHGSSRDAWLHLKNAVETEINSVTDNPIIIDENNTISGGNFHGQPLALPLDYAAFAASELGNISDRRTYLLLEGGIEGLPKLLMRNTGINSGFMIPQYTSAALVTENKTMCFPASADSIPTSLGQEDHVSMGAISARKTYSILENVDKILAVELLCAAQAFDFRRPLKSGKILEKCHAIIREKIDHAEEDRIFAKDIEKIINIISDELLADTAKNVAATEKINLDGEYSELFSLY